MALMCGSYAKARSEMTDQFCSQIQSDRWINSFSEFWYLGATAGKFLLALPWHKSVEKQEGFASGQLAALVSLVKPQLSPVWSTEPSLPGRAVETNLALEFSYTFWSAEAKQGFGKKPNLFAFIILFLSITWFWLTYNIIYRNLRILLEPFSIPSLNRGWNLLRKAVEIDGLETKPRALTTTSSGIGKDPRIQC